MNGGPIITFLSDFGLRDPYVSEMKAVILSLCPNACIVDVSHEIDKFNIRMGAFVLASAAPFFPDGTIHVAVVDPGVGTKRRPIIVETRRSLYVGPDNGLLMLAVQRERPLRTFYVSNRRYMLPTVSRTFHGRDVFAPAAAHLAMGVAPLDLGPAIHDYVLPEFTSPQLDGTRLLGEILYIDDFGNLVSNISVADLEKLGIREGGSFKIQFGSEMRSLSLCSAYGEVPAKRALALIGSGGFLEFSVNQGNAAQAFGMEIGDHIILSQ